MGIKPKVKIGVCFRREYPPEKALQYALEAEALGFEEVWVVEDCFYASGIAAAAATLASTDTMRVGLGIMPAVARNPVFSAMEIATIGRMYTGRLIAGVGHGVAGWMRQIGAFPRSQMTALREGVEIMRRLMHGERVDYAGKQFTLDDGILAYPPQTVPPIYLGVRGPKSLALSGEIADGTILAEYSSPAYTAWACEQIRKGNQHGQAHDVTVFVYAYACSSADVGRELFRPLVTKAILSRRKDIYFTAIGGGDELRKFQEIDDAEEVAKRVPDSWIDQMGIFGQPEDWQRSLDAFSQAGADTIVLVPLPEKGMKQVKAYAKYLFDWKIG